MSAALLAPGIRLHTADCLDVLRAAPDGCVDAVVTDPPYELGFMGKGWDASGIAYSVELWKQCLRVLKPGGHLAAFGGTRTYHRMTCAIEDAGFEIRDSLHWIYGSGFPKGIDVSKAIDKAAGAEREILDVIPDRWAGKGDVLQRSTQQAQGYVRITASATDAAKLWQGWNTMLKPAHEPIVLARKPIRAGTVAANVLEHGAGALNIDGCRVDNGTHIASAGGSRRSGGIMGDSSPLGGWESAQAGRWPPNILLTHDADCTDDGPCADGCPVAELDAQSGTSLSAGRGRGAGGQHGAFNPIGAQHGMALGYGDTGGASRFFPVFRYQAKAPRSQRPRLDDGTAHPTVKPLALMCWLVRLVAPPGGVVLDPFAGSGTTLEAALLEGMRAIGIEREEPYAALCAQRLAQHTR